MSGLIQGDAQPFASVYGETSENSPVWSINVVSDGCGHILLFKEMRNVPMWDYKEILQNVEVIILFWKQDKRI